jgi:streptomycin 6-kinase
VKSLQERVDERIREWGVVVQTTRETPSSHLVFGTRGDRGVVLKVIREMGDEWHSGNVLHAFDGRGTVRVYEHTEGAILQERLQPAVALAETALNGRDEHATGIIADVIRRMSDSLEVPAACVTVLDWGKEFQHYRESGDRQIAGELVSRGERLYFELAMSQRQVRLLHGDLHHYNVLLDSERGWVAIDPKGVVGELEYEVGATLRNPFENPELFASALTIEKRIARFEAELQLNSERALAWSFAQAVLSAIWTAEDGFVIDSKNPGIRLANAIGPMLAQTKFH